MPGLHAMVPHGMRSGHLVSRFSPPTDEMADAKAKVALVGFLDTKGAEHVFVKQVLESRGCEVVVIDVSITVSDFNGRSS